MKHPFCAVCIAAVGVGVGVGASAQTASTMKDGQMTVSGCVAAGKDAGQYC